MTPLLALLTVAAAPAQTPHDCQNYLRGTPRPVLPDSIVSKVRPVEVHYDASYSADQLDKAETILAAIELSWEVQVDQLGFRAPELPDLADGNDYDVYLLEYYPGTAFVAADDYSDAIVGDGYSSTSSYMVIDARLPMEWLELYVAHEFNHACQWSTDYTEWTLTVWEATATNAQVWTLGAKDGKWDLDVADFQEAAYFPALLSSSYYTYHGPGLGWLYEYGAALWVRMLDEKLGANDGAKGVELWEELANEGSTFEPDVVDAFTAASGTTFGDAMNQLALVRFLTGDDWDERGLDDAAAWGSSEAVPATRYMAADLPLVDETLSLQPFITGQSFIDIDLAGLSIATPNGGDPWLRVSASSALAHDVGLMVMWWDDAGQVGESSAWGLDPEVEIPAEGLTRVALGITNLGPAKWDGDENSYVQGDLSFSTEGLEVEPTTTDTGTTDTGTDTATDTGTTDTGTPTGGQTTPDTGTEPGTNLPYTSGTDETDGGSDDEEKSGCGCQAAGPSSPWWLALGLVLVARRRGRQA